MSARLPATQFRAVIALLVLLPACTANVLACIWCEHSSIHDVPPLQMMHVHGGQHHHCSPAIGQGCPGPELLVMEFAPAIPPAPSEVTVSLGREQPDSDPPARSTFLLPDFPPPRVQS